MNLTIQNRTGQNAQIFVGLTPAQGTAARTSYPPLCTSIPPNGQQVVAVPNASDYIASGAATVLQTILSNLATFGVVPSSVADAYNAAKNPFAPSWTGFCYSVGS